jgi:probable phosphoglycerate mutase
MVRHGQTEYNRLGKVQGSGVDADLNQTGRMQARAFYESYHHIPFVKVYTSTLKRSQQSVEKFTQLGIPTFAEAALNEISWGALEGEAPTAERRKAFRALVERWDQGEIEARIEGGESPSDVATRQASFVERLKCESEGPILICMHGRAMRILLCLLLGRPLQTMNHYRHQNLGLYHLEWRPQPEARYKMLRQNCLAHLTFSGVAIT